MERRGREHGEEVFRLMERVRRDRVTDVVDGAE